MGIYIYLLVSYYLITLKKNVFEKKSILFSPGKGKIWKKLIVTFFFISVIPSALIVCIIMMNEFRDLLFTYKNLVITSISSSMIIVISSVYIITAGLNKPIGVLYESFDNVMNGDYSSRIPVIAKNEIGSLISHFNELIDSFSEREFLRDTFGKDVAKNVADKIIEQDITLTGDIRPVTILYLKIENYTITSGGMTPSNVVNLLNDYFTFVADIIARHQGIVNKFLGDAVLAAFNAPADDPDHANHAVKAAMEIHQLADKKKFGNNYSVTACIGINTGTVIAGNIGSEDRREYTIIGDEVNFAIKLEQLNKQYDSLVLVGENTYQFTGTLYEFERVGEVKYKEKKQVIEVYKLKI